MLYSLFFFFSRARAFYFSCSNMRWVKKQFDDERVLAPGSPLSAAEELGVDELHAALVADSDNDEDLALAAANIREAELAFESIQR